ncbi:MAG: diguanylate cyclase [Pseudomonadota bacterium]|nr:diguanylate cyclase [Pseudomonadota bacterium]
MISPLIHSARAFCQFAAMLAALLALWQPDEARAAETACFTNGDIASEIARTADHVAHSTWSCEPLSREPSGGDWTLRFEIGETGAAPAFLHTRIGYFDRLNIALLNDQNVWSYRSVELSEMETIAGGPQMFTALPAHQGRAVEVVASFVGNGHGATLSRTDLREAAPVLSNSDIVWLMVYAALIGVLLIPIVLDVALLFIMRQSFLAWHIGLCFGFAALVAARTNILALVTQIPADLLRIGLILAMGTTVAAALMFTRSFIEDGKLNPVIRKAMPWAAVWVLGISAVHAMSLEILRPLGGNFHAYGMLVGLITLCAAMTSAFRNGSRAVKFQLVGWAPMFFACAVLFASHMLPGVIRYEITGVLLLGIFFESIATILGLADRFTIMRRERDAAITEARMLEELSERDPLTGLLNRRGLKAQFAELFKRGFDTFALVDLDRFKQINDQHGHQTGDAALVSCAKALRSGHDKDLITARIGGEEFVVLLRGDNPLQRAEALRQSIPQRIAADVPGLHIPVTGSMGVVELPRSQNLAMSFDELYARADALMYEVKDSGRNRMAYERMTVFPARLDALVEEPPAKTERRTKGAKPRSASKTAA